MEKNSKKIMFFAIVAVVIFAFPISFYEFIGKSEPITVTGGFAEFNWRDNFTISSGYKKVVLQSNNQTKSSAIISSTGYPNSTLTMNLFSIDYSDDRPSNTFIFWINVSGSLTSNLYPKNLVISETVKAYSSEKGGFLNFTNPNIARSRFFIPIHNPNVNLSIPENGFCLFGTGTGSSQLNFLNDSYLTKSTIYNFDLYRCSNHISNICSDFCFLPKSLNITYYLTFSAEITGLSKPVLAQVELIIKNVQE